MQTLPDATPALEITSLGHNYPDGTRSLDGINLSIDAGERVALLGPNGAGKSTLILHLNGVILPQEGQVNVGGTAIARSSLSEVRQRVGLVFQDPDDQLFMTSVYEDVAFGPLNMGASREEADRLVHEALHAVDLADVASKPGQHLSFGQKKRVALATVLSMSPEVLVLDEPTSNLDPRAKRRMVDLLEGLRTTLLIATHDMELAWRLCDRAVIVDGGTIVKDGRSSDVLTDRKLLEAHGLELPPSVAAQRAGTIEE